MSQYLENSPSFTAFTPAPTISRTPDHGRCSSSADKLGVRGHQQESWCKFLQQLFSEVSMLLA